MGIYIYFSPQLPSTDDVRRVELQVPLKIFTSDKKLIGEYGEIHRTKLTFEEIPEDLVNAFLAAEDSGFFSNTGVDFFSLLRATYEFVKSLRQLGQRLNALAHLLFFFRLVQQNLYALPCGLERLRAHLGERADEFCEIHCENLRDCLAKQTGGVESPDGAT